MFDCHFQLWKNQLEKDQKIVDGLFTEARQTAFTRRNVAQVSCTTMLVCLFISSSSSDLLNILLVCRLLQQQQQMGAVQREWHRLSQQQQMQPMQLKKAQLEWLR